MTITTTAPPAAGTLRAGRYWDAHALLDAAEIGGLPFPAFGPSGGWARITLGATVGAENAAGILADARDFLAAELHVEFAEQPRTATAPNWAVFAAAMGSGLVVEIHAWAQGVKPDGESVRATALSRVAEIARIADGTHARIMTSDAA